MGNSPRNNTRLTARLPFHGIPNARTSMYSYRAINLLIDCKDTCRAGFQPSFKRCSLKLQAPRMSFGLTRLPRGTETAARPLPMHPLLPEWYLRPWRRLTRPHSREQPHMLGPSFRASFAFSTSLASGVGPASSFPTFLRDKPALRRPSLKRWASSTDACAHSADIDHDTRASPRLGSVHEG